MLALHDEFFDFLDKISLTDSQTERIESAWKNLQKYLSESYKVDLSKVFLQGSFATLTTTRPAPSDNEGEYDVDLVIKLLDKGESPREALNLLTKVLKSNDIYASKLESRGEDKPCIRLRYADEDDAKFHVDIVPAHDLGNQIIEVPKPKDGWSRSSPEKFTKWILEKGEQVRRVIMYVRRWGDETGAPIKSILLQVLVCICIENKNSETETVVATFRNIFTFLSRYSSVPTIDNPVLPGENLANKWIQSDYLSFKEALANVIVILDRIDAATQHDESCALWQEIFGEDFIYQTDKEFEVGIVEEGLGDISHVQPLTQVFPFVPNPNVSVHIWSLYHQYVGWRKFLTGRGWTDLSKYVFSRKIKSGESVASNGQLDFYLEIQGMKGIKPEIYWQVVNTGEEAASKGIGALRGKIFPSTPNITSKHRHEATLYKGTHWIEAFIVMDGKCIARSKRFYVPIYHK